MSPSSQNRAPLWLVLTAMWVLVGLTACAGSAGSGSDSVAPVAHEEASPASDGDEQGLDTGAEDLALAEEGQPEAAPSIANDLKESVGKKKTTKLRPFDFPYKNTVEVESSLTPQCVQHGQTVELTVTTPPGAALAYQAVYSDNKSGAGAPFGEGYGGNDKGYADGDGHYTSAWVVAPNAPAGRARADVFVGFEGDWGYASTRFAVADANGECPQEWLEGES